MTIANEKRRLSNEEVDQMVTNDKRYKEDEKHMKKAKAKNALENYAYKMRDTIRGAANLAADDKKKMQLAFNSFLRWLYSNKLPEADVFKDKMKES